MGDWTGYFNELSKKITALEARVQALEEKEKKESESQSRGRRENGGFEFFTKVGDNIVLQFGKFRGQFIDEVPDAYLAWANTAFAPDPDPNKKALVEVIKEELESRAKSGKHVA